jgi:DNA-binding PadR family transcriptional regulator
VILHLAGLGRLAYDDVGLIGHTQAGMSEALGIRQGTLTKVLSRLVAAKVVEVDRRHVHGEPRRLNVYRLTALGESVARDVRHHRKATEPSDTTKTPPN